MSEERERLRARVHELEQQLSAGTMATNSGRSTRMSTRERDPGEESPRRHASGKYEMSVRLPSSSQAGPSSEGQAGPSRSHHPMDLSDLSSDDYDDEGNYGPVNAQFIKKTQNRQAFCRARRGEKAPPVGDLPQEDVREIKGWPYELMRPPVNTNPALASHWYDFVPVTGHEATALMDEAHQDTGEARHRITDLLCQLNSRPEMAGVEGMRVLQLGWRNDEDRTNRSGPGAGSSRTHTSASSPPYLAALPYDEPLPPQQQYLYAQQQQQQQPYQQPQLQYNLYQQPQQQQQQQHQMVPPPGYSAVAYLPPPTNRWPMLPLPHPLVDPPRGQRNPRHAGSSSSTNPRTQRPGHGLRQPMYTDPPHMWQAWFAQNQAKIPTWMDLEIGGQRPTLASLDYHLVVCKAVPHRVPIPERGQWVLLANELFSILGLYERIVQLGNYPVRPYYNTEPYPSNMGDLSIFHLARGYGRMLNDQSPFVTCVCHDYFINAHTCACKMTGGGLYDGVFAL
ncbi:hypothetical protein FKP32DRAFT_1601952 [Trametes sanguinea]|nr:hypothetical protein FKP32DRAFT_1601952 [Trametes sanguinea]